MKTIALWQIKKIQTLISVLGLRDEKGSIVQRYSARGSTSTKGLYYAEAMNLLDHLEGIQASFPNPKSQQERKNDRKRKKMMAAAYQLDWHLLPVPSPEIRRKSERCMYHLEAWCLSDKCAHPKPIMEMTPAELDECITQLEQIVKKENKKLMEN